MEEEAQHHPRLAWLGPPIFDKKQSKKGVRNFVEERLSNIPTN
jgi:hypothetical protein